MALLYIAFLTNCHVKEGVSMRTLFALTVVLLALMGCATTANYTEMLGSWLAQSEIDLVRSWGPPQRTYEAGGHKFLVYTSSHSAYIPGIAPSYTTTVIGNTAYTNSVGGTPGQNIGLSCQTTFELAGEWIISTRYQGNNCTALPK